MDSYSIAATKNPREAAFSALLASWREQCFLDEYLSLWKQGSAPDLRDYHLAREIAFGTMRMQGALDYLTRSVSTKKTQLKPKEKAIIWTALYQSLFMDKIPLYAIADEAVKLSKKYVHQSFGSFVNALVRKTDTLSPKLPLGNTSQELAIRYSYPNFYVEQLIGEYGIEQTKELLEAGNIPGITMARVRKEIVLPKGIHYLESTDRYMAVLDDPSLTPMIGASADYYIQNATQALLIHQLCQGIKQPRRILDLCASPGGKLVSLYDHFPEAQLFANDMTPQKLARIEDNCKKYGISPVLSCSPGEFFQSADPFDLIVVDAPCSNTGVLNKRPEARWRLTPEALEALENLQRQLISHAFTLLAPRGEVWYLTCSIIKGENRGIVDQIAARESITIREEKQIFQSSTGWDGGYACALQKK